MIVKMSKIELVGPKELLDDVISFLLESAVLQVEPGICGFVEKADIEHIKSSLPDEKSMAERLFLENLRSKCNELFSYLPVSPLRYSYLEPRSIIDSVSEMLDRHLRHSKELFQSKESLQKELTELSRYTPFLETIGSLLGDTNETPALDFIGITLRDATSAETLRTLLVRLAYGRSELYTGTAMDGSFVGLIAIEKSMSEKIKKALGDVNIPELVFPASLNGLGFSERLAYVKQRIALLTSEIEILNTELKRFSLRWGPIYKRVKDWIDERLSLLDATSCAFETRMCFFIYGWIPSKNIDVLRRQLDEKFSGRVVIEEKAIREEDLGQIPVILKNPPYFKPFELFSRLLPLPRYTSYDPTPFIGIFFPLFFGMILGDAGYGLLLLIISLFLMRGFRKKRAVRDAAKILLISSVYAIFFGILYGEVYGELGHRLFGLEPIFVNRRTAVIPMLYFSLSVGIVHIILGLVFGVIGALKKKTKKEALCKFFNILVILCIVALVASFFGYFPGLFTKPVILAILFLTPLLLFTGGLLAPLEIIKSIGNIISYVRIMAIGLTSVLLAFVANHLGGMTGDIVLGVVVAGLLHLLNIILGVFSPTIHSLRLHYVEFFGKFLEHGGRRFEPLSKTR